MTRTREQTGSVLVISLLLMTLMVSVALAGFALVDQVQTASRNERVGETSFNVAEALLASQVYILSRGWPGTPANAYPASCANGSTNTSCPDAAAVVQRFGGPDVAAGITWSTAVRDNQSPNPNYYDDVLTAAGPSHDANHDGQIWVRAQVTVRGRRRTLVGLVRVERVTEQLPRSVIVAGHFGTTNNGKKVIVDTQGSAAAAAPLQVRCALPIAGCLDYPLNKGQVSPNTVQLGYAGGNGLSDDALDRLRERAIADGTYYASGCPANPSGAVVFVENGNCSYNNSTAAFFNTAAAPGVLIVKQGTLSLNGNSVFYGVVYMGNRQASSGWVVSLNGTAAIQGGVQIDGAGGLLAGSSAVNVVYDPNVFNSVVSYANAGIIQNTWREIPG